MLEALNYSDLVRLGGSRSKWDYEARYARYRARLNYHASSQLMADAKRAQPAIAPLREVAIDHSHELGDIVFENIFTNTLQHKMIQQSTLQMQQASEPLEGIIAEQKKRVHEAQWRETQASSQLEDARLELQKIRSEAFERLAGEGGYDPVGEGAELPPYTA